MTDRKRNGKNESDREREMMIMFEYTMESRTSFDDMSNRKEKMAANELSL